MFGTLSARFRRNSHSINPRRLLSVAAFAIATCIFFLLAVSAVEFTDGTLRVRRRPFSKSDPPQSPSPTPTPSSISSPPGTSPHDSFPPKDNGDSYGENRLTIGDYRVLTSKSNNMGFYNVIDTKSTDVDVFNPTLLELPRGCQHEYLIIARGLHIDEEINGVQYRRALQLAMFANSTYSRLGRPELTTGPWYRSLVEDFNGPEHHCMNQPKMDKYIGPEDMKLYWTKQGAPLLIFTNQTPDRILCEAMFVIDARAAVPELSEVCDAHALSSLPPIVFDKPTLLHRQAPPGQEENARYQREKNWAPVQLPLADDDDDALYFMTEPSQLFKWKSADAPVEEVPTDRESAVEAPYPPGVDTPWRSETKTCVHDVMRSDARIHQSTPMISLTLCDRGTCEPDMHNTLLLGMLQQRLDPPAAPTTKYNRRIVAYNASSPYSFVSVSKILTYHGEDDAQFIWTGSMVYYMNATDFPKNRSHGYLDDEVRLSFGIKDKRPGWIDIDARELITDHYYCKGASELDGL